MRYSLYLSPTVGAKNYRIAIAISAECAFNYARFIFADSAGRLAQSTSLVAPCRL